VNERRLCHPLDSFASFRFFFSSAIKFVVSFVFNYRGNPLRLLSVEGRFLCDDIDYDAVESDLALDVS